MTKIGKWKGGILLPAPGRHPYGFYEIVDDDEKVIGEILVTTKTRDGRWQLSLMTDREIDLDRLDLPFVEDGGMSEPCGATAADEDAPA